MTPKVLRNLIKEMNSLFAKYHFENILTYDADKHKMLQFELHNDWETALIKCIQFTYRIEADESLTYVYQFRMDSADNN